MIIIIIKEMVIIRFSANMTPKLLYTEHSQNDKLSMAEETE